MRRRNFLSSVVGIVAAGAASQQGFAQDVYTGPDILKVEEDWHIEIGDPDPNLDTPQIMCVFGPQNALYGIHSVFELNHGTQPDFSEGGMQLQCWDGNTLVGYKNQHAPAELHIPGEIITFTTVIEATDRGIEMEIINGQSESWGEFGNERLLRQRVSVYMENLNRFNPFNSIRFSRVTFGANRVKMFKRTEYRRYSAEGLYSTSTEDVVVERWDT